MDRGAWWAIVHGVFSGQNTGKNTGVGCHFLLQGNLPNPQIEHGSQPACQGRRHKKCWLRKIPWRRKWQPTPDLLPGECHGERSLEGYGPQCCKESDTTEVTYHAHIFISNSRVWSKSLVTTNLLASRHEYKISLSQFKNWV